jgi:GMP synthase (glutamine-hydrolysing)
VDASRRFLTKLKGVKDPERKRKIIGRSSSRSSRKEAKRLGKPAFLAQGTLYPDVIESTSVRGPPRSSRATTTSAGCPRT